MDVSMARAHGRDLEAREFCSALVNVDGNLIRRHRSLRNQLCLTRTAAAFLLLVSTSLSAVIYIQHRAAAPAANATKHNLNNEGLTEKLQDHNTIHDPTKNKNFTTLTMSRPLHCTKETDQTTGFIQWESQQSMSPNFKLTEDNKSLIFNQQGWYQITLQITYQLGKHQERDLIQTYQLEKHQERDLIHYLIRNSSTYSNEDETLLTVYDVLPKNSKWKKSVHSAQMVRIYKNDRLKVKSERMQHLHCESIFRGTANFLMAQLIDPNI